MWYMERLKRWSINEKVIGLGIFQYQFTKKDKDKNEGFVLISNNNDVPLLTVNLTCDLKIVHNFYMFSGALITITICIDEMNFEVSKYYAYYKSMKS